MSMEATVTAAHVIFSPDQIGLNSSVKLTFFVEGDKAVEMVLNGFEAYIDITLKDFLLTVQVDSVYVD